MLQYVLWGISLKFKELFQSFRKSSLKVKVWGYLIIFCVAILILLWFFQVVSLKSYYEYSTKREIAKLVTKIEKDGIEEENLNKLSHDYGVCIEVYSSLQRTFASLECKNDNPSIFTRYKYIFMEEGNREQGYEIVNPKYQTKSFMYGILVDSKYAFITVSLEPVDSTVQILKSQLLFVSLVVLSLSLLVAYYISRRISKPIEKINSSAKLLAHGNYDTTFESDSSIEELNELVDTLNKTSIELAKTESLRREFMANVSHDLKTPLTMIKAYAEMVRDLSYKTKEKREEHLNVIIQEADRLNLLVNDILELSKIQAGAYTLKKCVFDLDTFTRRILKQYDIYTIQDGYTIEYQCELEVPIFVCADMKRIEQVFYNLINNALNYTGEDKKIIISLKRENGRVLIQITDTGNGIAQDKIDSIWDKYYKVDKSYSRMVIGTGVGLSIVKSIFLHHNIEYGVKSKLKKGTTFYFYMDEEEKEEK